VERLAFSPDGAVLVSASRDTTALVWKLPPSAPPVLVAADLPRLWSDLTRADAAAADRAIWTLASAPGLSVPFLRARLEPVPRSDAATLERLLADLDAKEFRVREQAKRRLL